MASVRLDSPLRLSVGYALFGSLWILVSDGLMVWSTGMGGLERLLGPLKGLLFIGVTAVLLYGLARRMLARTVLSEHALRDSRERLSLALEAANQGLYDLDLVSGDAIVNSTYATMLGYDPATFRETNAAWRERLHPEDRDKVYRQYEDYIAGRTEVYRVEFRSRTADGGWRWLLSLGRVVERDAQGRPWRMLGTHTDITDRKLAEERLADSLRFAQTVLDSSPVGMLVFRADGEVVTANGSAARIVGTSLANLLQVNFRRLDSWRRLGLLTMAEQALAGGNEMIHRGPVTTDFGKSIWLEARMVRFIHDGAPHLLLIINDEAEKQQAMESLRLMEAAVQAAPVGWVVTDTAGVIQWVNPGFTGLTGYTAAEVIGQNPRILKSGRHHQEFYAGMWATIRRGEVWSGEIFNQRKDGTQYHERMTIAPVRDREGRIAHFVAIKEDISERKRLEQQLTRTQRLESIGLLASGIAHDLNNVLTPILLSSELLRMKYPDAAAAKYVDNVESAAKRGAGIVRQILTFARGMDDGARTEVQPRYLLRDVVQLIEETFPRNIQVRSEVPRDIRPVMGDLTQLHQVILNLAVNARDAMPQGGTLTLAARNVRLDAPDPVHPSLLPGDFVLLTVADSGTGIPPEVLDHMFEPFYTTKPRGKGTGLGLSTVYGIVRSHGGVIDVRTELGKGSAFEIRLPVAACVAGGSTPPPAQPTLQGRGRRILVVDDEESIRSVTARILERHGFVPVCAEDGLEGLAAFRADPVGPVAAIVDMMMPRMNGMELIRAIRETSPRLPVLISTGLMSSEPEPDFQASLQAMGVSLMLQKPYTEEQLSLILARALGGDRASG